MFDVKMETVIMFLMIFFGPHRNVTMPTVLSTRRNVKVHKATTLLVIMA